jgi:gp16 family phage-associated protein
MSQYKSISADIGQKAQNRVQVKQWFEANGLSITDWATARGFKREQVYAVLNGRSAGRRGTAHRIAVALGLKTPQGAPHLAPDPPLHPVSPTVAPAVGATPGGQEPNGKDGL